MSSYKKKTAQLCLFRQDYPQLKTGDQVLLSIQENLLLKISLVIYGIPLFMLLMAALISAQFAPIVQIIIVVASTLGGVWMAKQFARTLEKKAMRLIKLDLIA